MTRHIEAWVDTIHPDEATGTLKSAYDWQAAVLGRPAEYTQLGSLHPQLVEERLRLYKVIDNLETGLSEDEKHLIVYLTSVLNETVHCSSGALARLQGLGVDAGLLARVLEDPEHAGTGSARLDEIARYTAILTRSPGRVTEQDIDALRAVGLSDADIVALNNLSAYYAYTNRVATGLGLRTTIAPQDAHNAVPE